MIVEIFWPAVFAGAVVSMLVGYIWYGPMFAKPWMKLVNKTEKELQANAPNSYISAILLALVQTFALRHFVVFAQIAYPEYTPLAAGLLAAWWAWLGFCFTSMTVAYLFAARPRKLILIDTAYHLVVLLINGAILSLWI
jgi:hypothetical protein